MPLAARNQPLELRFAARRAKWILIKGGPDQPPPPGLRVDVHGPE
jgi:hypothetical protein